MKKIILIFFLLFSFEATADPWVSFLTGFLEGMTKVNEMLKEKSK